MKIQIELHDNVLCRRTIIDSHLLDLEMEGYMPEVAKQLCAQVEVVKLKVKNSLQTQRLRVYFLTLSRQSSMIVCNVWHKINLFFFRVE
jgi:hypothetical protein